MAMIQGIRIRNFKSLKDITLGNVCDGSNTQPLTPITAVIGKNGVGKTSLFDVFGFLADCMKYGVAEACDVRGGFDRVVSQGENDLIELKLCCLSESDPIPTLFDLKIAKDKDGKPYVKWEWFYQFLGYDDNKIKLRSFLEMSDGVGFVHEEDEQTGKSFMIRMTDKDKQQLATATVTRLKSYPHLSSFRNFVEGWYMSYFTPDAARNINQKGAQQHLNRSGDNLSNVVEFMMDEHPERFQTVLERIASKIPGIGKISTYRDSVTRNLYLMLEGKGFAKPFIQSQMSDGTLKLFTYLLLLEDPEPAPLLCIEEPENGLYHQLLETLAQEIREHTSNARSQVFITTHQPYFVDALEPEEVWILEKGEDGFSTIRRASDDPLINAMVEESQPLGALWYSGYLDAR
ncbi:AAA family ATPase [Candidatus Thiothrix anitrata]|uniref:AAA family ATPase n=1 Tax=Candidatus Thiothrix anitrata TaxID=2823902 RepID=A0ABX7WZ77_9GAMM|nr:AAA family ATPase [Candidatus Thiothrix anitrata]QTR48979.1 AAA family ATPase [Candidatus Thiothrix anitrata]